MKKVRILLADDHDLFREGLATILDAEPDFAVIGEAGDGLAVVVMARKLLPDMILMDIGMPGCNGVEATRQIKAELPDVTIIMLTVRNEDDLLFEAIKNGAQGYLLKNIRSRELLTMLRGAVRGEAAITPALGGRMLEEFRRLSLTAPAYDGEEIPRLTARRTGSPWPGGHRRHRPGNRRNARHQHSHGQEPHAQHPRQTASGPSSRGGPVRTPPGAYPSSTQRRLNAASPRSYNELVRGACELGRFNCKSGRKVTLFSCLHELPND